MKMLQTFAAVVLIGLMPSWGWASYQNPSIVSKQVQPSGFIKVTFEFAGDNGEPTVKREYLVRPTSTAAHLRNWVHTTKAELDFLFTASNIAGLQVGQTIPALAPTPDTPTAAQVWWTKMRRYLRVKDSGIAALAADLATLKADLEATYQTGFIDAD